MHDNKNPFVMLNESRTRLQSFIYYRDALFVYYCDLFKKIRDTKATFHAKMGSIKDRSGMDLTEGRGSKNTQKNYTKRIFMAQITTMVCH